MLPLYTHPYTHKAEWDATIKAITAHQDLTFYIVINPSNGPTNSSDPYNNLDVGYNINWVQGVDALNKHSNVVTLGYVSTAYNNPGKRTEQMILADIDNWSKWPAQKTVDSTSYNISIHGIWYDETSGQPGDFDFYERITKASKTAFGTSTYTSVLNVGVRMDATYERKLFGLADVVVTRETCWQEPSDANEEQCPHKPPNSYTPFDAYKLADSAQGGGLPENKDLRPKASIIVHYVQSPRTVNADILKDQIAKTVSYGIHSTYFTSAKLWEAPSAEPATVDLVSQVIADSQKSTPASRRQSHSFRG
ncbi:hypothetical protein GQ53DRAFT_821279 [Thozetella sp. PMI_491]|nr:hypothetical protein GQ53DRAFT_821279 [Thozetella sp. PMI_491]